MRWNHAWPAVLAAALGGCGAAHGATPEWRRVVLVELFTSQGCSSCPRADGFVRDLPSLGLGRQKVVPLTFHVDYWNGLGWRDRFAKAEFTARQEWYARSTKLRSADGGEGLQGLYTPQMVIDGAVHLSGGRRREAMQEMERAGGHPALFELEPEVVVNGASVDVAVAVRARPELPRDLDWRIRVALVARDASTAVQRGENAGQTLAEAAVVQALSEPLPLPVGPGTKARVRLPRPKDVEASNLDVVVFVQSQQTGVVGGAAQGR
jgi:hypothetical protein